MFYALICINKRIISFIILMLSMAMVRDDHFVMEIEMVVILLFIVRPRFIVVWSRLNFLKI